MRKYRKRKLDNIFKWLEVFIYSLKGSRVQKSGSVDECRCWKESQNMDWLENIKEKDLRRTNLLIDVAKYHFSSCKEIAH